MKPHERNCSLTLDEMSIQAKTEYDISSKSIMGHVTLPEHNGIATHGLVFMLSGLAVRWKQTVAFYFTGKYLHMKCMIVIESSPIFIFVTAIQSNFDGDSVSVPILPLLSVEFSEVYS